MKPLLIVGGIGILGYVLYRGIGAPVDSSPAPDTSSSSPAPTGGTATAIRPAAATDPRYSPDGWNWFIEHATGQVQPAPEDFGYTRDASLNLPLVSWDEYKARRVAAGLGRLTRRGAAC